MSTDLDFESPASASAAPVRTYHQLTLPGTSRQEIADDLAVKRAGSAPEFEQFQGTFATQEYIQATIKHDSADITRIISNPANHDLSVWLYESLRQILLDSNLFVEHLGEECTASSCPKMSATDNWVFLCAAHGGKQPQECCAIDYILHTLTGFSVLLTSTETFPTRYTITPKASAQFGNIARRLYRVFAHAYYHHRALFDKIESTSHLTQRFIQFSLKHELMTAAQLTPPIDL